MDKFVENLDLTAKGIWLPYTVGLLLFLFVLFMPKRITWREIFFVWMTVGFMAWMNNTLVAVLLDLHDLGSPDKRGVGEIINYTIIPPALSVIFLNYFREEKKWKYAVLFTLLSYIYQWGLIQVGNMKLQGWRPWWSIPIYLTMFGIVIPWILRLLRKEPAGTEGTDGERREFELELFKEKAR